MAAEAASAAARLAGFPSQERANAHPSAGASEASAEDGAAPSAPPLEPSENATTQQQWPEGGLAEPEKEKGDTKKPEDDMVDLAKRFEALKKRPNNGSNDFHTH